MPRCRGATLPVWGAAGEVVAGHGCRRTGRGGSRARSASARHLQGPLTPSSRAQGGSDSTSAALLSTASPRFRCVSGIRQRADLRHSVRSATAPKISQARCSEGETLPLFTRFGQETCSTACDGSLGAPTLRNPTQRLANARRSRAITRPPVRVRAAVAAAISLSVVAVPQSPFTPDLPRLCTTVIKVRNRSPPAHASARHPLHGSLSHQAPPADFLVPAHWFAPPGKSAHARSPPTCSSFVHPVTLHEIGKVPTASASLSQTIRRRTIGLLLLMPVRARYAQAS